MANDYMKDYVNTNSGYEVTALLAGGGGGSGNMLSDYASIKNGSYQKMMKAYCAKREAEKASVSGDTAQKLKLMGSSADALKKSVEALSNPALWEKMKFTGKDEETGEETETEDYDWEAITKAVKSFVDHYNTVVEQTGNSDTKGVLQNAAWMTGMTEKTQKLLSKIGLHIGSGNKLELNEENLKKANINTLKSTFSGYGSFADRVSQKAGNISRAASVASVAAKAKGTYTKNGKYSDILSNWLSGTVDKKVGDKTSEKDKTKDTIQQAIDKREKEKAEKEKKEQEKKEKERADRV